MSAFARGAGLLDDRRITIQKCEYLLLAWTGASVGTWRAEDTRDREQAKEDVIEPKARWNRIHQWYASGPATRASFGVKISATSKFAKIHRMRFWYPIPAVIQRDRSEPARPDLVRTPTARIEL